MATDTFLIDCWKIITNSKIDKVAIRSNNIAPYLSPVLQTLPKILKPNLLRAIKQGRVKFAPLVKYDRFGIHDDKFQKIYIAKLLRDMKDISGASLVLIHEGAHDVLKAHKIDEEIIAYHIEASFYEEIKAQISNNSSSDKYKIKTSEFKYDLENLLSVVRTGKILDYLLEAEQYREFLTLDWILKNEKNYGGWQNSSTNIRKCYIDCICRDYKTSPQGPGSGGINFNIEHAYGIITILKTANGNMDTFYQMLSIEHQHTREKILNDFKRNENNSPFFKKLLLELDDLCGRYRWNPF